MRKLAAGFAVAAVSMLGMGATAGAYPPGAATMTLSPSSIAPGGDFTGTLSGCTLGEVVSFTVSGDSATATCAGPAGSARVATPGAATASATLTAPTAPGTYAVTGTGGTSGVTATATLTVTAPAAGGGQLPTTGSDSAPIAQIAAGAVLAGLALTGVALYRRRTHAAA